MSQITISAEATKCFEIAMDMWGDSSISQLSEDKKRDITAMLALAIKKAACPYPLAESRLALFQYCLGETKEATRYADLAIQHDSNSFTGQ